MADIIINILSFRLTCKCFFLTFDTIVMATLLDYMIVTVTFGKT